MSILTASALPRVFRCPGSAALPQARTASEYADAGTDRHAEQEEAIADGSLDEMPPSVRALIPADATSVRAEVAVALDVATGQARELGVGIGRAYGTLGPFEIAGTMDLLALAPGRALVGEWKSFLDVGAPESNEQVLFLSTCVARIYDLDEVTVAIAYLGTGRVVTATLDRFDLDAYAERLRQLHLDVAEQRVRVASGGLPDVSQGSWCKHCPANGYSCPAVTVALRRIVSGAETDDLAMLFPLDDDTARDAYERLQAGKQLLRRVEAAIYSYAAERPIPLGNGRYFGAHTKKGNEKLDGEAVWAVVAESYGRDIADMAVIRNATKKRLEDVLKHHVGKGASSAVLDEVRRCGGATREDKTAIEEFTAAPRLVAAEEP